MQQPSPEPLEVDPNAKRYISSLEERVSALTFENNKLKSANESLQMSIKSLEDNGHVSDTLMLQQQQQQQLKTALEQRVSSLQRQSELVEVFDAACVKPLELIGDGSFGEVRKGYVTLPVAVKTARRQGQGGGGGPKLHGTQVSSKKSRYFEKRVCRDRCGTRALYALSASASARAVRLRSSLSLCRAAPWRTFCTRRKLL